MNSKIFERNYWLFSIFFSFITSICYAATPAGTGIVSGKISGQTGSLTLRLTANSTFNISVLENQTDFSFPQIPAKTVYKVEVVSAPTGQTCTLSGASGTISVNDDAVSNVAVTCTTNSSGSSSSATPVWGNGDHGETLEVIPKFYINGDTSTFYAAPIGSIFWIDPPTTSNGILAVHFECFTNPDAGWYSTLFHLIRIPGHPCALDRGDTTPTSIGLAETPPPPSSKGQGLVSGKITGQSGPLSLQNNGETIEVSLTQSNFNFKTQNPSGNTYNVKVSTQPTNGQTCIVSDGSGTIFANDDNVTNVAVTCPPAPSGLVSGKITGQSGALTLKNNAETLQVSETQSTFTFITKNAANQPYHVQVLSQPPGQSCTVTNASGAISANDDNVTNVAVTCPAGLIGGNISGQTGSLSLRNSTELLQVSGDQPTFTFNTKNPAKNPYNVQVWSQPPGQSCSVSNASGTISTNDDNVTNIQVKCDTVVAGLVSGTITGQSGPLALQNNGETIEVSATQSNFNFDTKNLPDSGYKVQVVSPPIGQTCAVSNATGTISTNDDNVTSVTVTCATNSPTKKCDAVDACVEANGQQYLIKTTDLNAYSAVHEGLDYGVLAVPYKYYTSDRSLTGAATVGGYVGYQYGRVGWAVTPVIAAGEGVVNVTTTQNGTSTTNSRPATSAATGFIFTLTTTTRFQIGILAGKDMAGHDSGYTHEGKTWLAVSFGAGLTN